ncbi:Fumarate reductase (FRDS) (FAD-dependent oxidoreductase) (NADH-dependent fumarate reductase) [Durusdinium trenchii]|uniref:Fumarate reductase (FRDS) (FAD-dependent oxidoreductase) (NADH-dependent fumarate reductase) n=1 Tax=Durusdinium trenchii TaxID=1381693 RepID=A0ABP0Q686_9DINO
MGADGQSKASRVVGSVGFERPTVPADDGGAGGSGAGLGVYDGVRCAMPFVIKFDCGEDEAARQAALAKVRDAADKVLDVCQETFSRFVHDSEISKFNALKAGDKHVMSPPMRAVVQLAALLVERSRGAFDPAVAPLLEHYQTASNLKQKRMLSRKHDSAEEVADDQRGAGGSAGAAAAEETKGEIVEAIERRTVQFWRALLDRGFGHQPGGKVSRAVDALREFSTWDCFEISEDGSTLTKLHDEAKLELNGIAKGWAIDELARVLVEEAGRRDVFVDWAGDIKVRGRNPVSGKPWTVAVVEPPTVRAVEDRVKALTTGKDAPQRNRAVVRVGLDFEPAPGEQKNYLALLELRDGAAVATSGDYEQVYAYNGRLFSHVLNPKTAMLQQLDDTALAQVTVVSSSCMVADALATAALATGDVRAGRAMLDPFRTGFREPISDFLLYAREGPRVVRLTVPGVESKQERRQRLADTEKAHVIVVGGGLAGMSAAIEAADAGASVTLLEKEPKTGGNSAKATSGINGWGTETQARLGVADEERLFERDTFRSGKGGHTSDSLVRTLSTKSASAVHWLKNRFGVPLTVLSQLGGHSAKRTHRAPPDEHGRPVPIGFLIMKTLRDVVETEYGGRITVLTEAPVTKLRHQTDQGGVKTVVGVTHSDKQGGSHDLDADAVVLTTGGFGCDQSDGGLLMKHRPDLKGTPTTNGAFASGDGVKMATALGANLIDMDKVQLHPTGFIDPKDPGNATKFLAPEAIRGSGAVLLNSKGERFVNELDLRSVVAAAIQDKCSPYEKGDYCGPPFAWCLMAKEAQELFGLPTLGFYKDRLGLFEDCATVADVAAFIGCDPDTLRATLDAYAAAKQRGVCVKTGKMVFPSALSSADTGLVLARVTPSVHYTMGGLDINAAGEVQELLPNRIVGGHRHIRRLFAAGEVTGGVHGNNRLGGNSLLECVVFGRIAGERAATIKHRNTACLLPEHGANDAWRAVTMREIRNTDETYGKNTREIRFNLHGSLQFSGLAVGQYVGVRGELDGETLMGFFSPITRPEDEGVLGILCRFDEKGGPIYRLLEFIRPGSVLHIKAMGGLKLNFRPEGIFYNERRIKRLGLLAGGTGIAPMIQIIREYLHRTDCQRNGINLLYAADQEGDLAFMKILEDLRDKHPDHFRFYAILNRPPLGWTEGVGFIKAKNIRSHIFFPPEDDQLIVMCGPPVFESIMCKTLQGLGFPETSYYSYAADTD